MPNEKDKKELDLSKIDLSKIAVGTFPPLGGMPVDHARSRVLDRAGVPRTDKDKDGKVITDADGKPVPHPLRAGLVHTHGAATHEDAARLPETFPPADFDGPLASAQDWLDLLDQATSGKPAKATKTEAAKNEKIGSEAKSA